MLDHPRAVLERPTIELLLPLAQSSHAPSSIAPRLNSFRGETIGLVSNSWVSLDIVYNKVRTALADEVAGFQDASQLKSRSIEPEIADRLVRQCSGVINGLGNCGGCTTLTTLASIELERRGIPTVTLVTETFRDLALLAAEAAGMPDVRLIILPFPFETLPSEKIAELAEKALPLIKAALTQTDFPSLTTVG